MFYFAYGSNMSLKRIRGRVPQARFMTTAFLPGYALRFHKIGRDGSGKCDAYKTGHSGDRVYGVVYKIDQAGGHLLDRWEDLGYGYGRKTVVVLSGDLGAIEAETYYAIRTEDSLKPFHWYKEHVMRGAAEWNLPGDYIQRIAATESVDDPVKIRVEREMAIYS